ncbi:MAG TPA: tripartite tricarboxylate transporter substrate binding protein [Casimicrobiaceae bacterium]
MRAFLIALLLMVLAAPAIVAGETGRYPERTIRLIVPTVPGTPPDTVARIIGDRLANKLGQAVVVENRPGAIGTIGLNAVARSAPDGYTLGMIALPYIVAPALLRHVPYDTERDLAPVTLVAWNYAVLAVRADSKFDSVEHLIRAAKAQPRSLSYSSNGNGTPSHLAAELFKREAGIEAVHVPYKGAVAAVTALLAGDVDFGFAASEALLPQVRSGKLRALATDAPHRLVAFADVPTMTELGFPHVDISDWQGIVAPAGTPRPIIDRLNEAIANALSDAQIRGRLESLGMEPAALGPDRFAQHMRIEIERWSHLVRDAHISAD